VIEVVHYLCWTGLAALGLTGAIGLASRWLKHKTADLDDEREERQALNRAEMRHRHRMELAEKLETAAAMVVADKAMAEPLRDAIDAEFPKVRVAIEDELFEDHDRTEGRRETRRRRKSRG
jgi:hypothetical protein